MASTVTFRLARTAALHEAEVRDFCVLFETVFGKKMSREGLLAKYSLPRIDPLGSFHGLLLSSDKIVGAYNCIPQRFTYFGKDVVFGLSVDTMIHPEYRGGGRLRTLAETMYQALGAAGIPFVYGFPNDNIYLIRKKVLKWVDVAKLPYYILPLRVGNLSRKLKIFTPVSLIACRLMNRWAATRVSTSVRKEAYAINKINDEAFADWRYPKPQYRVVQENGSFFCYSIVDEGGIKAAYLIDVEPLEKPLIETAVRRMADTEPDIDVVLYIGRLPFRPRNMIRLPKRLEPKTVHMSGRILDPDRIDTRVFEYKNWKVNLSNFDVR